MTLRSREQDRMHSAMSVLANLNDALLSGYAGRAQNLPSMLQGLGLGGTIALLRSKKEESDKLLAEHLATWLLDPKAGLAWGSSIVSGARSQAEANRETSKAALLARIVGYSNNGEETNSLVYRQATTEARHYAGWLKRLSKAKQDDVVPSNRSQGLAETPENRESVGAALNSAPGFTNEGTNSSQPQGNV